MEALINYLLWFDSLNQRQIELIKYKTKEMLLKKGEYFSQAGKIDRRLGFLEQGIIMYSFYNNKGKEVPVCIIDRPNFVIGLNPINYHLPASEYVKAVTDCKLLTIDMRDAEELSLTIKVWDEIIYRIAKKAISDKKRIIERKQQEFKTILKG